MLVQLNFFDLCRKYFKKYYVLHMFLFSELAYWVFKLKFSPFIICQKAPLLILKNLTLIIVLEVKIIETIEVILWKSLNSYYILKFHVNN